jgi:hypothetical protein
MAAKKVAERYFYHIYHHEVVMTKVGGGTPVCCGENMVRIDEKGAAIRE